MKQSSSTNGKPWSLSFAVLAASLGTLILLSAIVFESCKHKKAPETEPKVTALINDSSWVMPVDVPNNPTQADYYHFAWRSFVAMNWPTDLSKRGKPDENAKIGATEAGGRPRTTVWQSYKEQYDLFLEQGAPPSGWDAPNSGCDPDGNGGAIVLKMFSKNVHGEVDDAFNEATGNPLIDMDSNYVRYEVRINESEYKYFVDNQYYDSQNQKEAVHNNKFVDFPDGSPETVSGRNTWARFGVTEIKAAWRVLPADMPASQKSRYFWAEAYLMDNYGKCSSEKVTMGLVGLHIIRLTPSTGHTWFWSTFEHIDNLTPQKDAQGNTINPSFNTNPPIVTAKGYDTVPKKVTPGEPLPKPVPVHVSAPPFQNIPQDLQAINAQWKNALKGTVWENYMLIGTINPTVAGGPDIPVIGYIYTDSVKENIRPIHVNTLDMANSTMETYMYNGKPLDPDHQNNCVVCHTSNTPQFFAEDSLKMTDGTLQVFSFLFGMAQTGYIRK